MIRCTDVSSEFFQLIIPATFIVMSIVWNRITPTVG